MTRVYDAHIADALAVQGGHLSIGPAGATLHMGRGCTLSGFHTARMKADCLEAGLPVLDCSMVSFDVAWELIARRPMVAVGEPADPPPWHAFASAPLAHIATLYRAAGAEVHNLPADSEPAPASGTPDQEARP